MKSNILIDPNILEEAQAEVAALYATMEYRPQVVIILEDTSGKFLFVQSPKNISYWGFPQGGIDRGEAILDAFTRELAEEVGVDATTLRIKSLCYVDQLDIPRVRDGFTKGKRYYYFHCIASDMISIKENKEEVSAHAWVSSESAEEFLADIEPNKRQSILTALRHI